MDVIEAIHERWSVRAFTKETVGSELVDALVSAAVQAPSAMNLQPWAFVTIEGRDALQSYSDRAKRHLLDTMQCDSPLFQYRDRLASPTFDIFYGAPLLIVIAATSSMSQAAEDCCLAAQNLMLAAQGTGLGTCCIGFARPWLSLAQPRQNSVYRRLTRRSPRLLLAIRNPALQLSRASGQRFTGFAPLQASPSRRLA
jgi:nitroreductase